MATRYWRGGTGTWNTSSTTNWSASSGGAGGASVPAAGDDVIIDANSGTGTITRTATTALASLTITPGAGNPITYAGSGGNAIRAGLTVNGNVTWTHSGGLTLGNAATTCAVDVTPTITASVNLSNSTTAGIALARDFTTTSTFSAFNGAVNLAGYRLTASTITLAPTTSLSMQFGSGGVLAATASSTTPIVGLTAANVSIGGTPRIALTGTPTTGTRTISALPSATVVTVGGGSDTVTFASLSQVLGGLNTTGLSGSLTGSISLGAAATLGSHSTSGLTVTTTATFSQSLGALASLIVSSGTLTLTPAGTIANVNVASGATLATASALTATAMTVTGTASLGGNLSVTGTLSIGGTLTRHGFTASAGTLEYSSGTRSFDGSVGFTNATVAGASVSLSANLTVPGTFTVASGSVALNGYTLSCAAYSNLGSGGDGVVNFGSGGKIAASVSLSGGSGTEAGTGSYELIGAGGTGNVSISGSLGFPVTVSTSGTVTCNASVGAIDTSACTGTITGTLSPNGAAVLGNHSAASGLTLNGIGGSISTPSGLTIGPVSISSGLTLASDLIAGATTIRPAATLTLAGRMLSAASFGFTAFNFEVNSAAALANLAFGTGGILRVRDGQFDAGSITDSTGAAMTVVTATGTGTIELAGASTNLFSLRNNLGSSASLAGVTVNVATTSAATFDMNGVPIAGITSSVSGATVRLKGTGSNATRVASFAVNNAVLTTAVAGVAQDLIYTGTGTVSVANDFISYLNASPSSTWLAPTTSGNADGGNNTGWVFTGAAVAITPAACIHGHAASGATVSTAASIGPAASTHVHSASAAVLLAASTISPVAAMHLHAGTSPVIATVSSIGPTAATHLQVASPITIAAKSAVSPDSVVHQHLAMAGAIVGRSAIGPSIVSHSHVLIAAAISSRSILSPASLQHLQALDAAVVTAVIGDVTSTAVPSELLLYAPLIERVAEAPAIARVVFAPAIERIMSA